MNCTINLDESWNISQNLLTAWFWYRERKTWKFTQDLEGWSVMSTIILERSYMVMGRHGPTAVSQLILTLMCVQFPNSSRSPRWMSTDLERWGLHEGSSIPPSSPWGLLMACLSVLTPWISLPTPSYSCLLWDGEHTFSRLSALPLPVDPTSSAFPNKDEQLPRMKFLLLEMLRNDLNGNGIFS